MVCRNRILGVCRNQSPSRNCICSLFHLFPARYQCQVHRPFPRVFCNDYGVLPVKPKNFRSNRNVQFDQVKVKSCSTSREEKLRQNRPSRYQLASWKRRIRSFRYSLVDALYGFVISIMSISGESSGVPDLFADFAGTMSQHSKSYREMLTENLTIGRCSSLRLFTSCRAEFRSRNIQLIQQFGFFQNGDEFPGESMLRVGSF